MKRRKLSQLVKDVLGGPGYRARNKFKQLKAMKKGSKKARAQSRRDALEVLAGPAAVAVPDARKPDKPDKRYAAAMAYDDKADMPSAKKKAKELPWPLQGAVLPPCRAWRGPAWA